MSTFEDILQKGNPCGLNNRPIRIGFSQQRDRIGDI